mmetsp:Transcript_48193/g.89768  ORF Transcript_48193/g.89768 Transcript_48193/m.89768 type:complete len:429 (-) Transcript_48193:1063-2349(-)
MAASRVPLRLRVNGVLSRRCALGTRTPASHAHGLPLAPPPHSPIHVTKFWRMDLSHSMSSRVTTGDSSGAAAVVRMVRGQRVRNRVVTSASGLHQDAEKSEHEDDLQYKVVTFYWLVDVADPHALVQEHLAFMSDRDCTGRIYISEQGINAQLSGLGDQAVEYAEWVTRGDPRFRGCQFTVFPVAQHQFPRLSLRYKPSLVSLQGGTQSLRHLTDPEQRAQKVSAQEWRQRLGAHLQGGERHVVLDVRNDYEWDAGHFLGAQRPANQRFRDTDLQAPGQPLHDVPRDTPILMYCTGGIRCDVFSAKLREEGFTQMYTLEGGVQRFLQEEGRQMWDGELFVFDDRLATPNMPRDDGEGMQPHEFNRKCLCCGGKKAAPPHRNCANVDCNRLFLVCPTCMQQHQGHCSAECLECSQRQRPINAEVPALSS